MSLRIFLPITINYHVESVEIWIRNLEYDDLISACDVWCHTSHANVKMSIVGKCKQNKIRLSLVILKTSI